MRRRLAISLSILLTAAAAAALTASPSAADPPPGRGRDAEHERVTGYWTQARRDAAVPRDLRPHARPPGAGGGGGGGGGGGTGGSWTGGGDVVLTTGKVFFSMGGVDYVCSGSAVDTAIGTVVLTAGHCVKDGAGAFATNFSFFPAYNNGAHPVLGGWTASDLFTTDAWGGSGNFDDDAGFAVVYRTGTAALETAIQNAGDGSVWIPPVDFSGPTSPYSAFGYPAAKPYNGRTLIYCAGPLTGELDGEPGTQSIRCNMTGGSSGGPWLETFGDGTSRVSSLNSYGYSNLKGYMFGPIFGAGEQAAFNGAGTGDCTGNPSGYRCVDFVD